MKLENKQVLELVGVVAVVASLIFVGMQLMLDRRIARADQYFNRAEAQRANLRANMGSAEYYANQEAMWELGMRPPWWKENSELAELIRSGKLSVRNLYYQILESQISLLGSDSNYFQYQQGLLAEEAWQSNRQGIANRIARSEVDKEIYLYSRRPISEVIGELSSEMGL